MILPILTLVLLSFAVGVDATAPRTIPDECCAALEASTLTERVSFPGSATYEESVDSYFGVNAQLRPICIVQPLSAHDVSVAVRTLTSDAGSCLFAIRSGGHSTFVGASNIQPGVTIDLSLMNRTRYEPSTGIVSIQPGARWGSVYEALQSHNVMVPGGRTASVGVGGYLLGGGNSFYAARVGIACDSVEAYEIVLASGPQGDSNNFGIVTLFEMASFPVANSVWGGATIYNISWAPEYIAAASKFTNNIANDPHASWVGLLNYNSTTGQTALATSLVYTKPVARPEVFHDFYQIPNITDTVRLSTLLDITTENSFSYGYRNVLQTGTYLNREDILQKAITIHANQIEQAKAQAHRSNFALFAIIQPWVPAFWRNSPAGGGNVLGLERFDENMLNVVWDYSWDDATEDSLFYDLVKFARQELDAYARSTQAYNEYIYLNYAGRTQDPLRGYGADNLAFLKRVAEIYDPQGVFQTVVPGGFKLGEA
ncbi:hypothetical protein BDW75DRAFT_237393 [Aspergillus navahoensis]